MRVQKIEQIILTENEIKTLNELWRKIRDLEIEDDNLDEICANLRGAITEFLGVVEDVE